jgi:uncharacterized protein YegP (UPF0339 family)
MRNPKFQVFKGKSGEYFFRLRAGNGEPVLASEGYESMPGALNGIRSVKANAPSDGRYERKEAKNGQFFFVLRAGNNEPIGKSEMYKSKNGRDHGIDVIKRIAPGARIEDLTF